MENQLTRCNMEHINNIKKRIQEQIDICDYNIKYHLDAELLTFAAANYEQKKAYRNTLEIIEREFNPNYF